MTGMLKRSGYLRTPSCISRLNGSSEIQEVDRAMFRMFFEGCAQEKAQITTPEAVTGGVGCIVITLESCLLQLDSCLVLEGKGQNFLSTEIEKIF